MGINNEWDDEDVLKSHRDKREAKERQGKTHPKGEEAETDRSAHPDDVTDGRKRIAKVDIRPDPMEEARRQRMEKITNIGLRLPATASFPHPPETKTMTYPCEWPKYLSDLIQVSTHG